MDNKEPVYETNIEEGDEADNELPEYEDDEDFRVQMNEAIMRNMNKLENESNKINNNKINNNKIKHKKIKEKKVNNNISLGNFMKVVDEQKPKLFVSKRKQDKIGIQYKRVFNPRMPPYLLVKVKKQEYMLLNNQVW